MRNNKKNEFSHQTHNCHLRNLVQFILAIMGASRHGGGVILTNSKGQYLLVKGVHTAVWSFPKGHLEKNETYLECAVRECKEETGVTISDYVLINTPFRLSKRNYWYWEGMILNDNITLKYDRKEATDAGWFTHHEIKLLNCNCEVRAYFDTMYNTEHIISFNNSLLNYTVNKKCVSRFNFDLTVKEMMLGYLF
jgi:8-oxo-dGTP pyrophosphatase MutT (NUDIX family)